MQAVCDVLEQLLAEGTLKQYAIGGATAAGFHGEPLATRDVDVFDEIAFREILHRYHLVEKWQRWATALGLAT